MKRRGGRSRSQTPLALRASHSGTPPATSDPDPPESAAWCVPADELQALVNLLASPAVIPILQRLAVAPCSHAELCRGVTGARADVSVAETALSRLRAIDLIDLIESPRASTDSLRTWWSLTANGQELLRPLSGLATWYAANRDEIEGMSGFWGNVNAPAARPTRPAPAGPEGLNLSKRTYGFRNRRN